MRKGYRQEARELSSYIKHYRPFQVYRDKVVEAIIRIGGYSAIIFTLGIFIFVLKEAWPFMRDRFDVVEFFTSMNWYPNSNVKVQYGAFALFVGTLSVTLGSILISIPIGLGTSIYLSEFAPPRFREVAKVVIECLASIPSVVWGFMALTMINPTIIALFDEPVGLNVLNASLILALMSIPIMVSIGEDALRSVPEGYREAAESLGATRGEVVFKVVVPAARNGLFAAVLLGVGRAIGETMAVLMASGHAINIPPLSFPEFFFEPIRTLTATVAAEMGESPKGSEHYRALFTLGLALLSITFVINFLADMLVRKKK